MYIVYKTICKINNKFYIGVHKTKNIDDGYLGSGNIIKRAIKKYGEENFERIILNILENAADAYAIEASLVTQELVESIECYNLKLGGLGGYDLINSRDQTNRNRKISKNRNYQDILYMERQKHSMKNSKAYRKAREEGTKHLTYSWKNKKHSQETILKFKEVKKEHGKGLSNSQYGTIWITNGTENKKLNKKEIIPIGWFRGRVKI
jgi:hypothetical protein